MQVPQQTVQEGSDMGLLIKLGELTAGRQQLELTEQLMRGLGYTLPHPVREDAPPRTWVALLLVMS